MLWVNPADKTQPPDGTAAANGYTLVPTSIPLFINEGRPDLPTPLFPFNGWIQDVAFYNVVLDGDTIATHYANGLGRRYHDWQNARLRRTDRHFGHAIGSSCR